MRLGESGAQVAEFAFLTPMILSLLMGSFWMARAYSTYQAISRAAREGARVAVARTCSSCGNAAPSVSAVENAVLNSLAAASLDKTKVKITPPTCNGTNLSSKICYLRDIVLNPGDTPAELGVQISFSYPVTFPIPFVPGTSSKSYNLTAHVRMREEN